MDNDVKKALKHIGVAALAFGVILLTGLFLPPVALFIVPPIACGVIGWILTRNLTATIAWAGIGLAAGIGFFIAE